jgi:hypothetical protein
MIDVWGQDVTRKACGLVLGITVDEKCEVLTAV